MENQTHDGNLHSELQGRDNAIDPLACAAERQHVVEMGPES
jgi:hypothetical protein